MPNSIPALCQFRYGASKIGAARPWGAVMRMLLKKKRSEVCGG
jgi:hypothetical protein